MNYKSLIAASILVFAMLCFSASSVSAQKYGHMNFEEVLSEMPETKTARSSLEEYNATLEADFKKMQDKLRAKVEAAEKRAAAGEMSGVERQQKLQEIQSQEAKLQEQVQAFQQQFAKRQADLTQPLFDKLGEVIDQVVVEGGYDYIFDTTTLLYIADNADDITGKVKAKLGM